MANFITRSNSQLMLNGSSLRLSGPDIYWMGLSDAYPTFPFTGGIPSNSMITNALQTAKEMGATAVRSHMCISVGNSNSIWPTLGNLNASAFLPIDWAVYQAGQLGLYLILPLMDNWHYYCGGKHTFTDWRSIADETQFYTNSTIIADYEAYISVILNRVNQFSGIAYKNDPTILCWETINEGQSSPTSWTTTIANYIKSVDTNHLVMSGSVTGGGTISSSDLAVSNVDIYTDHYYPPNVANITSQASAVATANKVYIIGEYDWTLNVGGTATIAVDTSTYPTGGSPQSLSIVVTAAASQDYFDQVRQLNLSLTGTHTYTVSFYAKALTPYALRVSLQQNSGSYNTYGQQTFTLTASWTQYSFQVTVPTTDSSAGLNFNCGLAATTTWIDTISLTDNASPGTNLISNPGFSSGTTGWIVNNRPIDTLSAFITAIEGNTNISGDLYWNLQCHNDTYGYVMHNGEPYSMYYPGGGSSYVTALDMATRAQALRTHAYKMQGLSSAPNPGTAIPLAAPLITSVTATPTANIITWRGVVGGATYDIERYTNGAYVPIVTGLTDASGPYSDSPIANAFYRVHAYDINGVSGPYGPALSGNAGLNQNLATALLYQAGGIAGIPGVFPGRTKVVYDTLTNQVVSTSSF